ncbi:proline-rich protein 2-like [Penaeus monodon]|uniref:proline-rich protein 2-like n=1 Tax=Penaeus monodon TaxID=6687 RepID=UPI0018A7A41A|nr:proline-rich protein 2-like [Penaeus monodon]
MGPSRPPSLFPGNPPIALSTPPKGRGPPPFNSPEQRESFTGGGPRILCFWALERFPFCLSPTSPGGKSVLASPGGFLAWAVFPFNSDPPNTRAVRDPQAPGGPLAKPGETSAPGGSQAPAERPSPPEGKPGTPAGRPKPGGSDRAQKGAAPPPQAPGKKGPRIHAKGPSFSLSLGRGPGPPRKPGGPWFVSP